ncbi:hypothetical protein A3860_39540 [Niastella vici]|uniref:Fibronectin type-III domain-containing protein n=1 Tax=Niastella vici TaxID=1703345 RepID=A0A1V9FI72_9BACT|nr:DUF4998 domain-containing protein [Niastella vici]OQP58042.1 hypothetical protein A3860_39540 [Niastella vici]
MKNNRSLLLLLVVVAVSCTKMDNEYAAYLNGGEIIYPGSPYNLEVHPGRGRVEIQFTQTADPNVVTYKISWNNNTQHIEVPAGKANKLQKQLITGLREGNYTFEVTALDKAGNASTSRSAIVSGQSLGDLYESNLPVRDGAFTNSQAGIVLNMLSVDTTCKYSIVYYEDQSGVTRSVQYTQLAAFQDTLKDIKKTLNAVRLKTAIVPANGIDTFYADRTLPLVLMAADYVCTGTMIDYTSSSIAGPYPWNVTLHAINPTQLELVDNDYSKGVYHKIISGGSASYYGQFGVVINLDASNNVISVVNKYGQPSSNGRSAELDPSGINKFDPDTKVLAIKYWLNQPGSTHRTLFDETFTMK